MRPHLYLAFAVILALALSAQTPSPARPQADPAPRTAAPLSPQAAPQVPPSGLVQPGLRNLVGTVDSIRLEKWKTSSAVRQQTEANLASIRRDLDSGLPGLLQAADAAPSSLPALLPAALNFDALYDVVLRVAETAHAAAPRQQSNDLDAALTILEQGRRDFDARILTSAQASDTEIRHLRQQLANRAAAPAAPVAVPCPKPPVHHKHSTHTSPTPGT